MLRPVATPSSTHISLSLRRAFIRQNYNSSNSPWTRYRCFTSTPSQNVVYVRFGGSSSGPSPSGHPHNDHKWDKSIALGAAVGILGAGYYVTHLEQVPETGRWRFMNVSPKFEERMGEYARNDVREELQHNILPVNNPISRHVRRVVSRILTASNLGQLGGEVESVMPALFGIDTWGQDTDFGASTQPAYGPSKEWDVVVVNDRNIVNAMAVPGLVVVFTGILPICQDEQGLAAVLAHEIGHVVARHSAERLSSQTVFLSFLVLLQILGFDWGISSAIQKLFLELPNSRTQEQEADVIGLRLMSRACYNPEAAPRMFERLGQLESKMGSQLGLDFFRTHPSSVNRVKYLEDVLPEAYNILASNPECDRMREQFERFKATSHELRLERGGGYEIL